MHYFTIANLSTISKIGNFVKNIYKFAFCFHAYEKIAATPLLLYIAIVAKQFKVKNYIHRYNSIQL